MIINIYLDITINGAILALLLNYVAGTGVFLCGQVCFYWCQKPEYCSRIEAPTGIQRTIHIIAV